MVFAWALFFNCTVFGGDENVYYVLTLHEILRRMIEASCMNHGEVFQIVSFNAVTNIIIIRNQFQ